jgi:rod shape-determining protein MreD
MRSNLLKTGIILMTFIVAAMLTIMPLPDSVVWLRPAWVGLVVIYWSMAMPQHFSIGFAWAMGLFMDILLGTLLGQHALALSIIAYFVVKLHTRLRLFPLFQQSLAVLALLLLYQFLAYWPEGLLKQQVTCWTYWLAPVVGMLLWPWAYFLLRSIRQQLSMR